jgi:hypothetical protein
MGERKGISPRQTAKITKPKIIIEITLAYLTTWMHSVCNKATVKCHQYKIFITETARKPEAR